MPSTVIASNHAKYDAWKKQLDMSADSFKMLLMRSDFVFNKREMAKVINVRGDTGAIATISFTAPNQIDDSGSGFLTAGFIVGNKIEITGTTSNNIEVTIASVTAGQILTEESTITTEGAAAGHQIRTSDEYQGGNGYTSLIDAGSPITMTTPALVENDSDNRADWTIDDVAVTASGGTLGPIGGAIIFDETSTDDTIIGYIDFGGPVSVANGENLNIAGIVARLN